MTEHTLVLPRLVAGRDFADDLVDSLGDISGETVTIDASRLLSGTPSFAGQVVNRVLTEGKAALLVLSGAPAGFADQLCDAAATLGVADRLEVATSLTPAG